MSRARGQTPVSRLPGFTIIELMVVIIISLTISGMALGALLEVKRIQQEASARNQMSRDAQLVMDQLGYDLNYFGVGVPEAFPATSQPTISAAAANQMRPALRQAKTTGLVFAGDLPYPNAELNGIVFVAARSSDNDHKIAVTSEISPCVPARAGAGVNYTCDPENESSPFASHVPSDYTSADTCTEANGWPSAPSLPARLCPWGQNKWQRASDNRVALTLGSPGGTWYALKWPDSPPFDDITFAGSTESNGFGLHLYHGFPSSGESEEDDDESGEHELPLSIVNSNGSGTAYVAHIDRVFYSLESGTLYRRQCWGATHAGGVDPGHTSWPMVSDALSTTASTPSFCSAPTDGTGWETLVSGVGTFALRYFDRENVEVDVTPFTPEKAAKVRVVEATITVSRTNYPRAGQTISHTLTRRFHLRNWGGIAGIAASLGGCGMGACGDD